MNSREESGNKQKKVSNGNRASGRPYFIVSGLFIAMFLVLIVYLIYFMEFRREEFLASSYNTRTTASEALVTRGSILASDGTQLAFTRQEGDGTESRVYPFGPLFAQTVGYIQYGESGLEAAHGYQLLKSDQGLIKNLKAEISGRKLMGNTLRTTLDVNLQQTAWDALGDREGAILVLENETGKVLACVSKPSFDPNSVRENWDYLNSGAAGSVFLNRPLQGLYEPGSTFKIVTTLAWLREGADPDSFFHNCNGLLETEGYSMHCAGNAAHGPMNLADAFAYSCNTSFSAMGLSLNWKKFQKTGESLYLNDKLGLEIPNSSCHFSADAVESEAKKMQTSIGQGDTQVTPVEMAVITAAIANGGTMMKPVFTENLEQADGQVIKSSFTKSLGSVMSASESETLKNLMKNTVLYGTASSLNDLGISIGGKTGSAEHGDGSEETHSWFVGFGDTDRADITVCVIAESSGSSSDVAVPVAKQLFAAYYGS